MEKERSVVYEIRERDFLAIIDSIKDVLYLMEAVYHEMVRDAGNIENAEKLENEEEEPF